MRLDSGHGDFFEHPTVGSARTEAHRLARKIGGQFVVYVPVAIVESLGVTERAVGDLPDAHFDDLPF
jgi:hypothetical protein